MSNITLNTERIYEKGHTSKYWRDVKCLPQTVALSTWASNDPLFVLDGVIVNSHDKKEIGKPEKVHVQTYDFWLKEDIEKGIYSINDHEQR